MKQRGGKREGAGRPKGASFRDMVSLAEKKKFVEFVLSTYMEDPRLTVWVGDQIFGKAQQSVDLTSAGKPILIASDEADDE